MTLSSRSSPGSRAFSCPALSHLGQDTEPHVGFVGWQAELQPSRAPSGLRLGPEGRALGSLLWLQGLERAGAVCGGNPLLCEETKPTDLYGAWTAS